MILPLKKIDGHPVGGKAKGLCILKELGMNVPDAVVLYHPHPEKITDELLSEALAPLGPGPKAVRSSAVSEDGANTSYAGQFESFLNLNNLQEIRTAVLRCIETAQAGRVLAYSENLSQGDDLRISVILQNMVEPRVAGVVFSSNPANHRRDRIVINAIAGHGEELVSGKADAHHYELYRSGSNLAKSFESNSKLLTEGQLSEILHGTLAAEKHFKQPVDLEWAIDHQGSLHWLQVRPITTLNEVHFNELDSVKGESNDVWTLGNIGEMMPGVATPLTWSVSAEAIDYGMTVLADKVGAFRMRDRKGPRYIQMFYNRLFINMSHMMDYPKRIWLNTAEDVQFALSGKVFPEVSAKPEVSFPIRVINFFRQMVSTAKAGKHLKDLQKLVSAFHIDLNLETGELYRRLGEAIPQVGLGFGHHLMTSAQSGTYYSAFMRIMTSNKRFPEPADHHIATVLLKDIPDIESADAVKSLSKFAHQIRINIPFSARFAGATEEEALSMLQKDGPQEIIRLFSDFLQRHGHRCVRESELREKTWEENPGQLIATLQSLVITGEVQKQKVPVDQEERDPLRNLSQIKRMILRSMIPTARKAVARREISKALSIRMVDTVRKGYRELGKRMVAMDLLSDEDQIYFLTHQEIGLLLQDHRPEWQIKAGQRREILPSLNDLTFNEVCFGIPEPLEEEENLVAGEGQLKGIPVSSGTVEGPARIINNLSDAAMLKEGEIMVAAFTDIGWTPYFNIAAGLVTEIGSPLSHGAVVAREYGIPAVVGAKGARRWIIQGEWVRVDGNKGLVEKIEHSTIQ